MLEAFIKKSFREIIISIVGILFLFWCLGVIVAFYNNLKSIKIAKNIKNYNEKLLKAGQKTLQNFSQVKSEFLLSILEKK